MRRTDTVYKKIEKILRRLLSWIIRFFLDSTESKTLNSNDHKYVVFLHGGIGDILMAIYSVMQCSLKDIIFVAPKKFNFLGALIPDYEFIFYDKKNIFQLLALRGNFNDSHVGIFLYPLFEFFFVYKLIGVRNFFGFICEFDKLNSIGLNMKKGKFEGRSRISRITFLLANLPQVRISVEPNSNLVKTRSRFKIHAPNNTNYVCLGLAKTELWSAGRFEESFYREIIEFILASSEYDVIFLGVEKELKQYGELQEIDPSRVFSLVGRTSFEDVCFKISNCKFMLANDNGLSHLSRFLGVPTVVMYNFSDPKTYSWGGVDEYPFFERNYSCMPCIGDMLTGFPYTDNKPFDCPFDLRCSKTGNLSVIKPLIESLL